MISRNSIRRARRWHERSKECRERFPREWLWLAAAVAAGPFVMGGQPAEAQNAAASLSADALFARDHLVDVQVDLPAESWDKIRKQSRSFGKALGKSFSESPFTYVRGSVTIDGVKIENVGIRKKGFLGSLHEERPSLKIKFSEYEDQTPVAGIDRLTLNNNNQDPSRLNQYLAFEFFRDAGVTAPRCNLAKVTVNGNYLGIYSNVESIKAPFLQQFGDASGPLYEGTVADFFPDALERFELKNKVASYEQLREFAQLWQQQPLNIPAIEEMLDIEAFLRFWAVESLIGFWDGYTNDQNNYFLYQNPVNSKFYFIPWGCDVAFTELMSIPPYVIKTKSAHSRSLLTNRLYRDPSIRDRYHAVLRGFLENQWNEERLLAEVDRAESLIRKSIEPSNRRFFWSVRKVRRFIEGRRAVLAKEIEKWPLELSAGPRIPPRFEKTGMANVSFRGEWYDEDPDDPETIGEVEIDMDLDGEPIRFQKIGFHAKPDENRRRDEGDGQKPPTILLVGRREPDGQSLILALGAARGEFRPTGDQRVGVAGILIEGHPASFFAKMALGKSKMVWLEGDAQFAAAAMEPGARVEGQLDLDILRMSGGDPE